MMISPSGYVEMLKDKTYPELIRERERLTEWIRKFEKDELAGDRSDPAWRMCPSPDVKYQMYLEYLSELCSMMHEKYNTEYVWGGRKLKQDAEVRTALPAPDADKAERNFNATLELLKQVVKE